MLGLIRKLIGGTPGPRCNGKGCTRLMEPLKRGIPIFVCRCGMMRFGERTVTLDGPNNKITWSTTGAPSAAGDLGMDAVVGRPQFFRAGAVKNVAALDDIVGGSTALFTFNHVSGVASTGALGFTPKFVFYTGIVQITSNVDVTHANGFAIGTAGNQRGAGFSFQEASSPQSPGATGTADDAAIFGQSNAVQNSVGFNGGFTRQLTVTAFSAAGISLTWSAAVGSHHGNLLVIG